jgi:hypothetical protein
MHKPQSKQQKVLHLVLEAAQRSRGTFPAFSNCGRNLGVRHGAGRGRVDSEVKTMVRRGAPAARSHAPPVRRAERGDRARRRGRGGPGRTAVQNQGQFIEDVAGHKLSGSPVRQRAGSLAAPDHSSSNSSARFFQPLLLANAANSSGASSTISLLSCRPGSLGPKLGPL